VQAKRAEILFYYDARMCNPNGDPDENRPRIDPLTGKNLVTEFRLKRTIRDYITKVMKKKILMRQELATPGKGLGLKYIEELASGYVHGKGKNSKIDKIKLINDHLDIRLFGILFAVGDIHFRQIGPVQFSIGQSLNKPVEEITLRMVRIVPNTRRQEKGKILRAEGGTFGEKAIVRYSFLQFHGFVNNNVSEEVNLTEKDIMDMLVAMWRGTNSLSTNSKFGQKSRMILKVNYKANGYIGDLDLKCKLYSVPNSLLTSKKRIKLEGEDTSNRVQNITQVLLDIDPLFDTLSENRDIIESIDYEFDPELRFKNGNNKFLTFDKAITKWSKGSKVKHNRLNLHG
jgi:CRISPR-associated protein Csh2